MTQKKIQRADDRWAFVVGVQGGRNQRCRKNQKGLGRKGTNKQRLSAGEKKDLKGMSKQLQKRK